MQIVGAAANQAFLRPRAEVIASFCVGSPRRYRLRPSKPPDPETPFPRAERDIPDQILVSSLRPMDYAVTKMASWSGNAGAAYLRRQCGCSR